MKLKTVLTYVGLLGGGIFVTILIPLIAFMSKLWAISQGWPLKWTSFSFFGGNTDYFSFWINVIFWFGIFLFLKIVINKFVKKT